MDSTTGTEATDNAVEGRSRTMPSAK